jgi:hypothetical protein
VAVQKKQVRKHKRNNTNNTVQTIQNTVIKVHLTPKLTHITKTHTCTHPHITNQVKTTTVQVTATTVQDIPK